MSDTSGGGGYRSSDGGSEGASVPGAPIIRSSAPGSFSRSVLSERHPALIKQVRDAFPYGPGQQVALDGLLDEIINGVVEPLPLSAGDREQWMAWGRDQLGRSWFDAPFLWAESYFYRKLLEATGYFSAGPWRGIDPFAPVKQAELRGAVVEEELRTLDALADLPADQRATALLLASLWGNRADLGFRVTSGEPAARATAKYLVADDSDVLWELLPREGHSTLGVVADNTARELIPDLILIDQLLEHRHADQVVLLVKPSPYFVSDATTADVVDCLRRLTQAPGEAGKIGARLWAAMATGRVEVRTHPFFCAPLPYEEMPADLRAEFDAFELTILKGDLNYRRLVGDRLWPATTPFADLTAYFPGAVVALRTLKSDVIVGLDQQTLDALESSAPAWRTSGTHAVIQAKRHSQEHRGK